MSLETRQTHATGAGFWGVTICQPAPAPMTTCDCNPHRFVNPWHSLVPPPPMCKVHPENSVKIDCKQCSNFLWWNNNYQSTTDDLLLRSNVHSCSEEQKKTAPERKAQPMLCAWITVGANARHAFLDHSCLNLSLMILMQLRWEKRALDKHIHTSHYLSL